MNKRRHLISIVILLLAGLSVVPAQRIDPDHVAAAEYFIPMNGDSRSVVLPLADGKLIALLFGNPILRSLIRINPDSGRDTSFNCSAACNFEMRSMAVQPDGKYLVAGNTSGNLSRIIRLNTDGSIDPSFSSPFSSDQTITAVYTVTPAGQIYASTRQSGLRRLNSDGSFDNSFTPQSVGSIGMIRKIIQQPDGKILVLGGQLPGGHFFRLNSDGTTDTGWTKPSLTYVGIIIVPGLASPNISDALLQADGKVVIAGQFDRVNGTLRKNIARLNPDGTMDSTPAPNVPQEGNLVHRLMFQSDGKMVLYTDNQGSTSAFRRLNSDLTLDNSFSTFPVRLLDWGMVMAVDSSDRVTYLQDGSLRRLNPNGTQDNSAVFTFRTYSPVTAIAVQSDGKSVVAGSFTYLNDVVQPTIGRLNPDGTRDNSFVTGTGFSSAPSKMAEQAGGKILAFGNFTSYNGVPRTGLLRLNSDGSLDASFAPTFSGVNSFVVQSDGKILLFGGNITVDGSPRTGLARLNSDGTLDTPFNPLIGSPTINGAVAHPDGKITIAGSFASVNGVNRSNLARLNADGTLDTTLNAGNIGVISMIALAPNGQYVITRFSGTAIYKVNPDGAVDTSFVSPTIQTNTNSVRAILPLPGGSVIVGGSFTGPRPNIFRLTPKGSLDNVFLPGGASGPVLDLARQGNTNKIMAVGEFATIGGVSRLSIARIIVPGTPFDFDGDGRSDFMVTRPSDYNWHLLTSGTYTYTAVHFGTTGDKVVPADYDGDGKTDIAIWRPTTGDWWVQASSTGAVLTRNLGTNGDIPMPSDTDGSGKADFVVVTPGGLWKGVDVATGNLIVSYQFSSPGDQPVTGDFDGDGKFDLAFFRGSEHSWYYNKSSSGAALQTILIHWGTAGDIPAPADYDGDGVTDAGVFRPSEGNWYLRTSGAVHFGATGDKPVPADYDGDGKADIAVFRPSDGYWYQLPTTGGYTGLPWGISSDIPAPGAFLPAANPPRPPTAGKR